MSATALAPATAAPKKLAWSVGATSDRVLELLSTLDWSRGEVCDVGAGKGHFSRLVGENVLRPAGREPADCLSACDVLPESFEYDAVECLRTQEGGRLPFDDDRFDAVVSIEVVEHVEDQFAFLRELARITRPGGQVVVTTPNVLNTISRLRTLTRGFPLLFNPLPLSYSDPRFALSGHIHPISPYFLAFAALRAGLERPSFHPDRTKSSAAIATVLLSPMLLFGRVSTMVRMRKKQPEVLAENRELIAGQGGWGLLTCRTTVLRAFKPSK